MAAIPYSGTSAGPQTPQQQAAQRPTATPTIQAQPAYAPPQVAPGAPLSSTLGYGAAPVNPNLSTDPAVLAANRDASAEAFYRQHSMAANQGNTYQEMYQSVQPTSMTLGGDPNVAAQYAQQAQATGQQAQNNLGQLAAGSAVTGIQQGAALGATGNQAQAYGTGAGNAISGYGVGAGNSLAGYSQQQAGQLAGYSQQQAGQLGQYATQQANQLGQYATGQGGALSAYAQQQGQNLGQMGAKAGQALASYGQNAGSNISQYGMQQAGQLGALGNQYNATGQGAAGRQATNLDFGAMNQNLNSATPQFGASNASFGQATDYAGQLAGIENQEGPSAAQAQLQQGLNKAQAGNLAMARSGHGWGGSAGAMSQAQQLNAAAGQEAANQSAILRAQETAAARQRQAQNFAAAAGINQGIGQQQIAQQALGSQVDLSRAGLNLNQQQLGAQTALQQQQQNDVYGLGMSNLGLQAQQAAAQTGLAGQTQGAQVGLSGLGQGVQAALGAYGQGAQLGVAGMGQGAQLGVQGLGQAGQLGVQGLGQAGQMGIAGTGQAAQLGIAGTGQGAQLGLSGLTAGTAATQAGYGQQLAAQQAAAQTQLAGLGQAGQLTNQGAVIGLGAQQAALAAEQQNVANAQAYQQMMLNQYAIQKGAAQQQAALNQQQSQFNSQQAMQWVGAAANAIGSIGGAAAMMSDRNAKKNIEPANNAEMLIPATSAMGSGLAQYNTQSPFAGAGDDLDAAHRSMATAPAQSLMPLGGNVAGASTDAAAAASGAAQGAKAYEEQQRQRAVLSGKIQGAKDSIKNVVAPLMANAAPAVPMGDINSLMQGYQPVPIQQPAYPNLQLSDEKAKKAIEKTPGYSFQYKDPDAMGADAGMQYGIMAQDLEKTPAGRTVVKKMPDGTRMVDTSRLALLEAGAMNAKMKQDEKRFSALESKLSQLEQMARGKAA